MQGLNEALASLNNTAQVQKPAKTEQNTTQNEQGDSFHKMIENSVKEYETAKNQENKNSQNSTQNNTQNSQKISKNAKTEPNNIQTTAQNPQSIDEIMLENADFITLLGLLESQDGSMKTGISNLVSANLNKFLATEQNIKELKGAKSLQDLLNLSEKFGLGLSKIKITKDGLEALKGEFKNLHSKGFFNNVEVLKNPIMVDAITKKDIEKTIQKIENSDKNLLSKLILGQNAEIKDDDKLKAQTKIELKDDIDMKKVSANEPKIDLKDEIDIKKMPLNEPKAEIKTESKFDTTKSSDKAQSNLATLINDEAKSMPAQANSKSQSISSIDDYLANIMQKAIKESGEQNSKISLEQDSSAIQSSAESQASDKGFLDDQSGLTSKDMANISKLDAKDVKPHLRHVFDNFATQLQEKISEYKPPITRFHLTLNPGNLGEIEVTLINRGSNLHINFNSNNQTMQIFIQHQAEFKASLVNMGFSELSMNFSDNANKEQHQNENKKHRFSSKNIEQGEESLNQETILEVVLPKYF